MRGPTTSNTIVSHKVPSTSNTYVLLSVIRPLWRLLDPYHNGLMTDNSKQVLEVVGPLSLIIANKYGRFLDPYHKSLMTDNSKQVLEVVEPLS